MVSILTMVKKTKTSTYSNCIAFRLGQARKRVTAYYDEFLKPIGLTPLSLYAIGYLSDCGSAAPSELATALELERPTVSSLVERMVRDGLVQRVAHPRHRGMTLILLTPSGKKAAKEAYPRLIESDRALNDVFGGRLAALVKDLEVLNLSMEKL